MSDLTNGYDSPIPDITVKNSGVVALKRLIDGRDGVLCIAEAMRDIPFEVKRVYYISHLDQQASLRGKHAHHTLQQVIFCINGSFVLSLDDGNSKQDILMWKENVGVILGPHLWHTMHSFSNGCVLLVLASDYFNESDYIRNFQEFLNVVGKGDET
jgi:dTDP-4-dehydrorhamnose 3,5-epimerase-like enzyme